MAVAEAIARGLPVVTTPAGAIAEWIDQRAALVVEAAGLPAALARVLDDADLRARLREGATVARDELPSWEQAGGIVDDALTRIER